jgi:hypothetical protein
MALLAAIEMPSWLTRWLSPACEILLDLLRHLAEYE